MPAHCQGDLDQREIQNKNKNHLAFENPPTNLPFEFTPKKINGKFNFLRSERDPLKLNISEDSSFFQNVGQSMQDFLNETREAQNQLFPSIKNEFLFIKETVEQRVKHAKVF